MVSATSSSAFESLAPRPPTPPRDVSKDFDDVTSLAHDLDEIVVDEIVASFNGADLPAGPERAAEPGTPSSAATGGSGSTASKKVGFSLRPTYHIEPNLRLPGSSASHLIKRSPLSRESRPSKSILKVCSARSPSTPDDLVRKLSFFSPEIPGSFANMLQSVLQQLASVEVSKRLDAYIMLNSALKGYSDVPDAPAMISHMGLIMQFLTRDMAWKNTEGKLDVNIITQALKLTATILGDATISEAVDDDFKDFIIDRSIAVMQQENVPKSIIKMQIYLLAHQRFSSLAVTPLRAERIITALKDIEDRCSGNSVIGARIVVYQRLLDQAPSTLLSRISDWLGHVFHGMLSSIKDIRVRAIDFGNKAGLGFGVHPVASRALSDILETETEEGQTYVEFLSERLLHMVSDKELGEYVPQIWSVVTLFFRNKRRSLENWTRFKSWLLVIQRCLNASDVPTRQNAFLAWDKLTFTVMPDSTTSLPLLSMLRVPIYAGMDKRGNDKNAKQHRQCALNSLYNLLHYSFRPGLTYEEYDRAWATFVKPVLSDSAKASLKGQMVACRVILGLLTLNTGVWNPNAAFEIVSLRPEDLPKLEPRWVRSRLSNFLEILHSPIVLTMGGPSHAPGPFVDATWSALMQAIGAAGNQEVRTSNDLKEAVALLVNFLRKLWTGLEASFEGRITTNTLGRFASLTDVMIARLGSAPFAEEILCTNSDNGVEVASTPSGRASKQVGPSQSPFVILYGLFFTSAPMTSDRAARYDYFKSIATALISSKTTSAGKLELLSRSVYAWSTSKDHQSAKPTWSIPCAVILQIAETILSSNPSAASEQHSSQTLGQTLRNAMSILMTTMQYASNAFDPVLVERIVSFYETMCASAKMGAGDGGVANAVMEPFAKALIDMKSTLHVENMLELATCVLQHAVWPRTRASMDQAKKALWGFNVASNKTTAFDPFEACYVLVVDSMTMAYKSSGSEHASAWDVVAQFLIATISFLKSSPTSLLPTALRNTQSGIVLWVEDGLQKAKADLGMTSATLQTWKEVLLLIRLMPQTDAHLLKTLEPLIIAGFSSPHRSIVNSTIEFWNETFGKEASLNYSQKLDSVLRYRSLDAEVLLPGFPESDNPEVVATLPEFYEERSENASEGAQAKLSALQSPYLNLHHFSRSPAAGAKAASPAARRTRSSKPGSTSPNGSSRHTPRTRLRHDDSQIQFAPIESSPTAQPNESQHLTEHQKEVTARQQENAQLFPDFSSSPFAQSTMAREASRKRLEFTAGEKTEVEDQGSSTPLGLDDQDQITSDDLPSSPTPSSNKEATPMPFDLDGTAHEEFDDPPSSPPREDGEDAMLEDVQASLPDPSGGLLDTTIAVTDFANIHNGDDPTEEDVFQQTSSDQLHDDTDADLGSDIASDNALPTAQLQEEEAAADERQSSGNSQLHENAVERQLETSYLESIPSGATDGPSDLSKASDDVPQQTAEAGATTDEVTRIEDSFVMSDQAEAEESGTADSATRGSQRASRKRKRRSELHTVRKRKQTQESPFKRILNMFRQSQEEEEEDDDIGDEIIVASSQPLEDEEEKGDSFPDPSVLVENTTLDLDDAKPLAADGDAVDPEAGVAVAETAEAAGVMLEPGGAEGIDVENMEAEETSALPVEPDTVDAHPEETEPVGQQTAQVTALPQDKNVPRPRARGRPRKSERSTPTPTPTPSEISEGDKKSLKRRISTRSMANSIGNDAEEPLANKRRRSGRTTRSTQESQDSSHASQWSQLVAKAVVIPQTAPTASHVEESSEENVLETEEEVPQPQTPVRRVTSEHAGTIEGRPIATPRSIIGRLRAALVDLKGIFLPADSERELDDILFELRKETHEAARRGQEQQRQTQ